MQLTRSLGINENKTCSNPVSLQQSGHFLSKVTPSPAVPPVPFVDHDINATKRAPSRLPHSIPQEASNLMDPIFIVDVGSVHPFDLSVNRPGSYQTDSGIHSKILLNKLNLKPARQTSWQLGAACAPAQTVHLLA